ncbi:penicillin acylase family protein [Bacteriovoracaceae bacterium]|nr:penicillin acylase family protein [Bacteriovoracaceae bacterium]
MIKKILPLSLLIIAFLCLTFAYRFVGSKPQYSGDIKTSGVSSLVKVHFDQVGVPHIQGSSEEDVYYSLGHIIASERLFQMDIYRRLAQGRLSEVIGKKTIETDKLFRSLRLGPTIAENLKKKPLSPEITKLIKAYLKGVNDYLKSAILPIEFLVLNYRPEPFTELDMYSFLGYMGYSFGIAFKVDLLFSDLKEKLPFKLWNDIRYRPTKEGKKRTVQADNLSDYLNNIDLIANITEGQIGVFEGSNAWVLGKSKTKSSSTILASDPHVSFSNPGIWYEAHLKTKDNQVYGHFLPLVPFPFMGHDFHKGWGITISYLDDMDFFKFNIDKKNQTYDFGDSKLKLKTYKEIIKVKGEDNISLDIQYTHLGPMLSNILGKEDIGLSWTYYLERNRPIEGLYEMGRAKDMDEFKTATSKATSPGLNIIYADASGNIARFIHGTIPKRKRGSIGDIILDASNKRDIYTEYLSHEELPHYVNPEEEVIVSANYQPEGSDIFGYWQPSDRYETIKHSLSLNPKWDAKDLQAIQSANVDVFNISLKNNIVKNLRDKNYFFQLSETQKELLKILSKWDGSYSLNSQGASVFHVLVTEIKRLSMDELSDADYLRYCRLAISWTNLKKFMLEQSHIIWDVKNTSDIEDRNDVILLAFNETEKFLKQSGGVPSVPWGDLHPIIFTHPLGNAPVIGPLFNAGPYKAPGAYNQINNMRNIGCEDGFLVKAGPSTRRIIDFADSSSSYGILPFGNSGHQLSKFYGDQRKAFLEGKYRTQQMGPVKGSLLNFIPEEN